MGKRFPKILDYDITCLYTFATRPRDVIEKVVSGEPLTDLRTGKQKSPREMSYRQLDRALDALEGRTTVRTPAAIQKRLKAIKKKFQKDLANTLGLETQSSFNYIIQGETWEELAANTQALFENLAKNLPGNRKPKGKLKPDSKYATIKSFERVRRVYLNGLPMQGEANPHWLQNSLG